MTLIQRALNFLFPPYCRICGKQCGNELCENCYLRLKRFEDLHVIYLKKCNLRLKSFKDLHAIYLKSSEKLHINDFKNIDNVDRILGDNDVEFNRRFKTRNLDCLIYLFKYKDDIRKLILDFKFFGKFYLSKVFAKIMLKNEKLCGILKFYDIIISVPMHKNKFIERGYNQAELLAQDLAENLGFEYDKNILVKKVNNKKQSSLSEKERYENIKNVFKVQKKDKIKNKNVILVDDICTTSATLEECAKILKEAGAKRVTALVIAKD